MSDTESLIMDIELEMLNKNWKNAKDKFIALDVSATDFDEYTKGIIDCEDNSDEIRKQRLANLVLLGFLSKQRRKQNGI